MNQTPSSKTFCDGPHGELGYRNGLEHLCLILFDRLWQTYRERVSHVRKYEQVLGRFGAHFTNDHIAFRTFAAQQPLLGISSLARVFGALGYRAATNYYFTEKKLAATHFEHAHGGLPKIFLSELELWRFSPELRDGIEAALESHRPQPSSALLSRVSDLANKPACGDTACVEELVQVFETLPWNVPPRQLVVAANEESQYAAWVLVHGYRVNHFTSLVNSHGVDALNDIEKTAAALRAAGVPMKDQIEGERGSRLRQTATSAAHLPVLVADGERHSTMDWTYAYFELAERGQVRNEVTGRDERFTGFLGPQASHLFEMTRRDPAD